MSSEGEDSRMLELEEQLRSLSDELMQCQADKEFVWSLWKRLQVANPDLTQAVSLVVEREKHKAEMKDRKVLEILQAKDYQIQELEQKVSGQQQQQDRDYFVPGRSTVDRESALMKKELTALHQQLLHKSQELKEAKTKCRLRAEEERQEVKALEEENQGLRSRCSALEERERERERQGPGGKQGPGDTVMELQEKLHHAWTETSSLQGHISALSAQLSSKEREVATKEGQVRQLRRECSDVQTLYRQSTEHAAEQSHLIKQLEGLNLDTQKVLRNQEEAHTADTTSYQRLYKELSQCYQALTSSHQELSGVLAQKDLHLLQLQQQLHHQQQQPQPPPQQQPQPHQAQPTAPAPSPNKQTNFKSVLPEKEDAASEAQRSSPGSGRTSTRGLNPRPGDESPQCRSTASTGRQQGTPVQRSRSLSPASGSREPGGRWRRGAEQRIGDLEELLQLKTEENEELRKAHDRRRERLLLMQTNYKTVRDHLKEAEKSNGLPGGRTQRAEPWQLRQENSDGVWNELAYMKNHIRKLSIEKAGLEEELDMLRVQSAMDRATVKELHMCLANEHQELLLKVVEVKSSTPKKLSVSSERVEQSFKKIEQLERRMMSLEEETETLREEKEQLLEAKEDLARNCRRLKASLDHLRGQESAREEAALAQGERHRGQVEALEARLAVAQRDRAQLHRRSLKLRQELGILRAARDFYRHRAAGPARVGWAAGSSNSSSVHARARAKTSRLRGPLLPPSHRTPSPGQTVCRRGRSSSPAKDEWEDMSADSDSAEEDMDSLNSPGKRPHRRHADRKSYRCSGAEEQARGSGRKQQRGVTAQDGEQREPGRRGTGGEKGKQQQRRRRKKKQPCSSCSSLQQRVESLQRHIDILQRARKDAALSADELRKANAQITAQLHSLGEKLGSSKQLAQKLTSDLAGTEQQKKVLEMELQQWRQISLPHQTAAPPPPPTPPPPPPPVIVECSCPAKSASGPANPAAPQTLGAEVKQLQAKLKGASAEVTRQVAANKALRGQLQDSQDRHQQLQDKASHWERDANMKRQLVDDLKTRLKFLQDMEKSYRGQTEELEKKVKTLPEEATNRKALIESLRRRLSVATADKSQHEASSAKLKEELEKKEQRVHALQARVGTNEQALAALERTATEQMEGLTRQSTLALDRLQRQLGQAYSQLEQLHAFIKALASEILLDIQEVKQQLMKRRRSRQQANAAATRRSALSAQSMSRAKSLAASILNMSENDLADIMDTDQASEACSDCHEDQQWLDHLSSILQQKIPSAGQLMEAVRAKMKERKVLTEELAALATPVSEKA